MKAMHSRRTAENDFQVTGEPVPNMLLRRARKRQRWTQEDVAGMMGVGVASVGRWERGEVAPNRYDRELLCELFRRKPEELGLPGRKEALISANTQEPDQSYKEARKSDRPPFHYQLKRERELRNWSQEELAARVGTDPKTVSRWEQGAVIPRHDSREALCRLFGKSAEELGLLRLERPREAK